MTSTLRATVRITLKDGVLDPQGKAIATALSHMGHNDVEEVRQGKLIELEIAESDEAIAREKVKTMCDSLLANTVIENYEIEIA